MRFGFKAAQITMSAIRAEIQHYCTAMSIHSSPTEALNQDKVSMGTISSRKLRDQIELLYLQYGVHLLAICQAIDVAGKDDFSPFTKTIHSEVRKLSDMVLDDRRLDKDAEAVVAWLRTTKIFA